jgi:hypothetical protein
VLSKLAYLALCRSIQLLAILARGNAAKDLEILVLRHQLAVCTASSHDPSLRLPIGPRSPPSAACCTGPAGPASWSSRRPSCGGTVDWSPVPGPIRIARQAGRRWSTRCSG